MTHDQPSLETALSGLQPATLDEGLLTRLEAAAEGTLAQLTTEEIQLERFLREVKPAALTPDFLQQLCYIVQDLPFAVDEKILLFPRAKTKSTVRRARPMWAAAAAVALVGGATAWLMPTHKPPIISAAQPPAISSPGNFLPASYSRGIKEVHDEGIVWKDNNQPHKVVRVVYKDLITLKDTNGRTLQVDQPRVEYLLVPAQTD